MKNILVILGGLLLPLCANANRVAILDEGFNPNFPNTSVIGRQGCFSNRTIILQDAGTVQVEFLTASLCRNGLQFDQGPVSATVPRPYFYQPVESFPLGKKLRHGNDVSSAGWNYAPDPDIQHHMIQVFGIGRSKSTDRDSTTAGGGDNIIRALAYLANTDFTGLTAVSISVVARERVGNNIVTPQLCIDRAGQADVDRLLARNIPVIVALDNDNIPAFTSTWPACLKNVITVGGQNAERPDGSPGLGIGTHNINFFADDTVSAYFCQQ